MFCTVDSRMKEILKKAERIAPTQASVLIQGESGTGKELLARFIHSKSLCSNKKFITLNCAAVPENLLESELFGYEKGAFTGAERRKKGKCELAHNSTFLLDEIGDMPLFLQAKLLRVLQEMEIERLGGFETIEVKIRWISTTNCHLETMIQKNLFREDLYYRLNVIPFYIPPLRERKEDILFLSHLFVKNFCEAYSMDLKYISPSAEEKIQSWHWPGNIRELKNTIERSLLMCEKREISGKNILIKNLDFKDQASSFNPGMTLLAAERLLILKTLSHTKQNRSHAARMLGINVKTLRNKIKNYKKETI